MPKLTDYITGVCTKTISNVDASKGKGHQREFNSTPAMREVFGTDKRRNIPTTFLYLSDDQDTLSTTKTTTWYNSRERHPERPAEYRLRYTKNLVTERMQEGDALFLGFLPDNSIIIILTPPFSTIKSQLNWLFGIHAEEIYQPTADRSISWIEKHILEQIGIEVPEESSDLLRLLLRKYRNGFPTTAKFSQFARDTLTDIDPHDNPDQVLMAWIEREELLFRLLEKHFVDKRLRKGFSDTDEFIKYSLSVHNRRKSRVGHALENHLKSLFTARNIRYSWNATTENKSRPDFLFPSIEDYKNDQFPATQLTLLGAKSTCKDRWRQVLAEADRIKEKHLLTLEAAISEPQTNEMRSKNLKLVIPNSIQLTYTVDQQSWLMSVEDFIELVKERDH